MLEHAVLEVGVAWPAERAPEGEVAPQPSWRRRVGDLVSLRTERHRRQTRPFEDVSERTHGTRAQRSNRRQQHHIDAVVLQPSGPGRPAVEAHPGQIELIASVGEVTVRNPSEGAARGKLVKTVNRKHDVQIERETDGCRSSGSSVRACSHAATRQGRGSRRQLERSLPGQGDGATPS